MSGGSFQIYGQQLNYRLLALQPQYLETRTRMPRYFSAVEFRLWKRHVGQDASKSDETPDGGNVAGYPIRACTGQYCTEFLIAKRQWAVSPLWTR